MVRLFAALLLLGALSVEAQIQTQPTGLKKMDGSDSGGGGGSGTGWTYDAGEGAWIYTPSSGNSDTRILSDGISLQDAAGVDIMAMDTTLGATTYVAGRLAADAIEVRGSSSLAASGTITATNVTCSTGGGAVVGTLNATAGNVGRFVYVTRDGANTCTVGVASGQTLDGVTDGTTTVPSAGWKTFVQTTSTAWVTAGSYPVTGTLSGLTATKLPVATSATAVGDSAITHDSTTGAITGAGTAPYLSLRDHGGTNSYGKLWWDTAAWVFVNNAETDTVGLTAKYIGVSSYATAVTYVLAGDSVGLIDDGHDAQSGIWLKNNAVVSWPFSATPDTQIKRDAAGQVGIYGAGSTYGQLNVGTAQLVDTGTKPTCDAAHRGQVWYDAGGAGVADTYEICRKDAADAYAWTALY